MTVIDAAYDLLEIVESQLIKSTGSKFDTPWYFGHVQFCPPIGNTRNHPAGSWTCTPHCVRVTAALTKAGRPPQRILKGFGE